MAVRSLVSVLGLSLALSASSAAAADSLVINGGFESGLTGWHPLWSRQAGAGDLAVKFRGRCSRGFGSWILFLIWAGTGAGISGNAATVARVHFSVERGLYRTPFELRLSTVASNAVIRFTTDGTPPAANNGQVYREPLRIERTTTLRAAAFQTGPVGSAAGTHTYIFPDDIRRQPAAPAGFPSSPMWSQYGLPSDYGMDERIVNDPAYAPLMVPALLALPAMSIVMRTEDMFGEANGLYTHADDAALQAACSVEWINPDGRPGFQIDCGIQMHGGGSRWRTLKHPFRLRFKSEFGPARLKFPLFPDSPVAEFDTLDLRSDYNNHWTHGFDARQRSRGGLVRDAWLKDVQAAMGAVSSHSCYVHLYINGLYWGVYNPCERPDASFAASYFGGQKEDYDAFNGSEPSPPVDGDTAARNVLLGIGNLANPASYSQMRQYLNVPQYIDYHLLQWYGANQDWGATKNWYSFRRRQPGAGFIYMAWDNERVLESLNDNTLATSADGLHARLAANPDYRLAFADRIHRHFFNDGALTTNAGIQSWLRRAAQLDTAIVAESARWGDSMPKPALNPSPYPAYRLGTPYNRNEDWLGEQTRLLTRYFPYRSNVVLDQLRAAGLYPNVAAPVFHRHGGWVPAGFRLVMDNPDRTGTLFYTKNGVDPRAPVTGTVSPAAVVYSDASPLQLAQSMTVKARVRNAAGEWSALNEADFQVAELGCRVRITEIMTRPAGGGAYGFLELQNTGPAPADLGGASLVGVSFVFPPGTVLDPGSFLVLVSDVDPVAFHARYPEVAVFGVYQRSLADNGERLALLDQAGRTITSMTYGNSDPWPSLAPGEGRSLEWADTDGDPNDPANWHASASVGGSPGRTNPAPVAPAVRINEIMASNPTAISNVWGFSDWIELANRGPQTVDLSGWSLRGANGKHRFLFPIDAQLAPGGFLVVWCDAATNSTGLHSGFNLERQGDTLALYDAATNRVDATSYGPQVSDWSVGRIGAEGEDWQLNKPTPGSANQPADVQLATNLVINEWMANPKPGSVDWLELYNLSDSAPAALQNVFLGTGHALFQIKSLGFVAPRSHVRLWADEIPGSNHLDFILPAAGGRIDLSDATGRLIDQVVYEAQDEGASQGRWPDGSGTIVAFKTSASPGAANYLPVSAGPILNEIMASNRGAVHDSRGRVCDWLELYNPADTEVDLGGMSLSEGESKPGQWPLPTGAVLAAKGFLVIWFDASRPASSELETDLNTGRALPREHGELYLFSAMGECISTVEYGFQVANASIGRILDPWRLLDHPTPNAPNSSPAALGSVRPLQINEWMTGQTQADDWFELFNSDPAPVELSGLCLTDDPSIAGQTKFRISPLSFVDGRGWVKWVADEQLGRGRDHVNFRLDAQGETLRIYADDGTVVDTISYGVQQPGISEGRLPDGSTIITVFPRTPTPGAMNTRTLPPVMMVRSYDAAAGAFHLQIKGTGPRYLIQSSTNLVLWNPRATVEAPQDLTDYADPVAASDSARFYRVIVEP